MEIRPDVIGMKPLYFNPASDVFTTANLAAIDGAYAYNALLPYAYIATVRNDYDAFNFHTSNAGSTIAAGVRIAFGLFLTPENDKENLLFQVTGKASLVSDNTDVPLITNFFIGRAASNTVVSDKTTPQNTMAKWMFLPKSAVSTTNFFVAVSGSATYDDSIREDVFTYELEGGFNYVFGYVIDNHGAAGHLLKGHVHLSFRKYASAMTVFSPDRG